MKREVRLKINGIEYAATVPDRMLLVQFIRDVAGLKGRLRHRTLWGMHCVIRGRRGEVMSHACRTS